MRFVKMKDGRITIPMRIKHYLGARELVYAIAERIQRGEEPPTSRTAAKEIGRKWLWFHGCTDDDSMLFIDDQDTGEIERAAVIAAGLFPELADDAMKIERELGEDENEARPYIMKHPFQDQGNDICAECDLPSRHPVHNVNSQGEALTT